MGDARQRELVAKRSKKPTNVKDLPATGASAVKGGASLNFGKVTFKYC